MIIIVGDDVMCVCINFQTILRATELVKHPFVLALEITRAPNIRVQWLVLRIGGDENQPLVIHRQTVVVNSFRLATGWCRV